MKFKSILATLALSFGLTVAPTVVAQSNGDDSLGEPIITFKTNIYDTYGVENAFYIYLGTTETDYYDVDCGYGTSEYEVEPAYYSTDASSMVGTTVSCRVNSDGIVKVYGDASKIDYFVARGCYIEWLKMDECVNLTIIDVCHNELKALDLSPFSKLQAIYVGDNTFSAESPLKIGANKPNLAILEMDIVEHLDQSFNLSDYPAMQAFDAYHNLDLRKLDPTGCPNLMTMSLDLTNVESLDVTKNSKLVTLNISETRISEIDLSGNPNLTTFLCQHISGNINTDVHLKSIDVTNNPKITYLNLVGNEISDIDLSKNIELVTLKLRRNNFSSLDISNNTSLYRLDIAYNDFDFVTLPLPQVGWSEYYYQRDPLPCAKSFALNSEIDFSKRVVRAGYDTFARVMIDTPDGEPTELDASYYTHEAGKITFNQIPADSVYVEFACSAFADYTISTANFMVKDAADMGKPSNVLNFSTSSAMAGKTLSFKAAMAGASASAAREFYVDVNGSRSTIAVNSAVMPEDNNVNITLPASGAATVEIYMPEGEILTAFGVDGVNISSIDLTQARDLAQLSITNCGLLEIDTSYNRMLRSLDLSNNRLSGEFSFAGVYGDYEKNLLTDINLSHNYITGLAFVNTAHILKLNVSNNRLTELSLKDFDGLTDLNLSNNKLSGEFSITYLTAAENINLSNNAISSLKTVDMPNLKSFNISNNSFTLATLPVMADAVAYEYAPQKNFEIVAFAPAVNISSQNRVIDGMATVFTWKKEDGTVLTEGVDYIGADGAFKFIKVDLGKVYCEMTHPAFPALAGENTFRTTMTTVTGAPTTLVASFTTTADSENGLVVFAGHKNTALYIDWRGDGTEYIQYPLATSYTRFDGQTTYAGANVKVYTYESPEDVSVFSIDNVAMSSFDATPMTKLKAFTVSNAGLDESSIVFPVNNEYFEELNIDGNNFSTADFAQYPSLVALTLSNNKYEHFDVKKFGNLQVFNVSNNALTELTFDNKYLWSLMADGNQLEAISFDGCPIMTQVNLFGNQLKSVDVSAVKNTIRVLDLGKNALTFATLPVQADYPNLSVYAYRNQAALAAECVDGVVDFSALAEVNGTATNFAWYLGAAVYDSTYDEYTGEALVSQLEDAENPEYLINDGVTKFCSTFDTYVMGVLTNDLFPGLALVTSKVVVDKAAGVENVAVDNFDASALVDVYTVSGVKVRSQVAADSLGDLAPGIYILSSNGVSRKIAVK